MRLPPRAVLPHLVVSCACTVAVAVVVAACGGSAHHRSRSHHTVRYRTQTVEVYSGLPLAGPSAWMGRAVRRGITLALAQAGGAAGDFLVRYRSLNDARTGHGAWAAGRTASNARAVATDPAAIAYIGELDSSATRISLPILNQAGIPQVSPWSPYVGLTRAVGEGVSAPGDPARYYPTAVRTFLRLAPDDGVQAAALLTAARDAGCSRLAVLRSGNPGDYSSELSSLLTLGHTRFGVRIVSSAALPGFGSAPAPTVSPAIALRRYVGSLRTANTGCVTYLGDVSALALAAIAAIHAELPRAPLLGSDRVCQAAFGDPVLGRELAAASGGLLDCTMPALPPNRPLTGRFISAWETEYGFRPPAGPWAAYGYEAMRLVLSAIAGLGAQGDQRARVLAALFAARPRTTLFGSYGFSPDGDSTVRAYGLWQVRPRGAPRLLRVTEPAPVS